MEYISLIGGLILLVVSGDYLVKGAASIAKRLKISSLVIGMTVVAFGTSAPELLVSLQAALNNSPEIALGNVIGSNIANIGLILGLTALLMPIPVNKVSIKTDWPFMMIASVMLYVASMNNILDRYEGICGFLLLLGFTIYSIKNNRTNPSEENNKIEKLGLSIAYIIGASIGLAYGAKFLVDGATSLALQFGVSQRIIGMTIVAFGTSLPELAASITAAYKKETDISIGNIIGSNLFNIFAVLGLTATIKPIPIDFDIFRQDLIWMLLFAFLLFVFMIPWKQNLKEYKHLKQKQLSNFLTEGKLGRISGLILLILYIYYILGLF